MTDSELEKAKREKITQIKFAANSAIVYDNLIESGFSVKPKILKGSQNEAENDFNSIKITQNLKNPETVDVVMTFDSQFIITIENWNQECGIKEFKKFVQIISDNKDAYTKSPSHGFERYRIENELEKAIGKEALKKVDHRISVAGRFPLYTLEDFSFPELNCDELKEIQPEMIKVEGSRFKMGGETSNRKILVNDFFMAKTPVTQEKFLKVMGDDLSYFFGKERPVDSCSWVEAIIFCNRLSELYGKTPCYSVDSLFESKDLIEFFHKFKATVFSDKVRCVSSTGGFRLPTEAEMEYAMKGGINQDEFKYSGSDKIEEIAWTKENSGEKTHDTATKMPNSLGIYDLTGNVNEWCWDWFENFKTHKSERIIKGGSAKTSSMEKIFLNTSYIYSTPITRPDLTGFRIVQSL